MLYFSYYIDDSEIPEFFNKIKLIFHKWDNKSLSWLHSTYFSIRSQLQTFVCCKWHYQSLRWALVLRPKTSKNFVWTNGSSFFNFYFELFVKINSRIWFETVNSSFHFKNCNIVQLFLIFECHNQYEILYYKQHN